MSTRGRQWAFQIPVPIRTSADESAALVVVNIRQGCPALFAIAGSYRLPKCLRALHILDSRPESNCIQIGCSALKQHQPADPQISITRYLLYTVTVLKSHLGTMTWNVLRSHLTTTDHHLPPCSTVYGRLVLTAVLTATAMAASTRSKVLILHTTGRRPYLEPS